ncbi:MAG: dynamin family protein [Flaviflexus sp.]|nr:dynamin family protein [Flaviflexus sp.]
MSTQFSLPGLTRLVTETISALDEVSFPLPVPGINELADEKDSLRTQLTTRILPNLTGSDALAVVVFGGSSGAGKSTLINTLVGEEVTEASILRPTTRTPVLVHHPQDASALSGHGLAELCQVRPSTGAIPGLILVDAPDLDSIDEENRRLSARLADAADLWVFVTTASRYGDHIAWSALTEAHERGMTTAVILNRLPARAKSAVRADLLGRMAMAGMGESPLFLIDDAGAVEGPLEASATAELADWLALISRTHAATSMAGRTMRAMMPAVRRELLLLADAAAAQHAAAEELRTAALAAAREPAARLTEHIASGRLAQGAPTTHWLTQASSGGRLSRLVTGRPGLFAGRRIPAREAALGSVLADVEQALGTALTGALIATRDAARRAWEDSYVDTAPLMRDVDVEATCTHTIASWRGDCAQLAAPLTSPLLGREGHAALLALAAAGIGGAKKALGKPALAEKAREALAERCERACLEVARRFSGALAELELPDGTALRLRASELVNALWEDE